MSIQLRYAARSHIGLVRKNNQDSGYAGPHLLVLADGMGGPAGGDIASSVAVAHLAPLDDDTHAAEDLLDLLRKAVQEAHEELVARSRAHEELAGLGTTCVALLRSGNKIAMVHIGDSRAYLLRDHELTQVTTDHSFVQYLVETGEITAEEAAHHPKRSVLLRVLGDMDGDVTLDESVRAAVVGDRWLLCSDGLSGVVSAETIHEVLEETETPEECCEHLVALALRSGGPDNITCVVADVVDSDEQLTPTAVQVVGAASTQPAGASIGESTPAERAAMLRRGKPLDEDAAVVVPADPRRMSVRAKIFGALTVLVLLVAAGLGLHTAYRWSQTQYFLGVADDEVTLFQGIHQSVLGFKLYEPVKELGVHDSQLSPALRTRLEQTITLSSRSDAKKLLQDWQTANLVTPREAAPVPSQTATLTPNATQNTSTKAPPSGTDDDTAATSTGENNPATSNGEAP